jgi:hypothetical protein
MKIQVQTRSIYGNRVIYPHCDTAKQFARIAGTKTLTTQALHKIKALGYSIEEVYFSQLEEVMK